MNGRSLLMTLASLAALGTAQAQTHIGTVTLTRPTAPVQHQPTIHPWTGAHTGAGKVTNVPVSTTRNTSAMNTQTMNKADVPAGWYEVSGRVNAAAGNVNLPAGSTISVTLNDLTRPAQVLRIQFSTSRLSTPYQMVFNPVRLNRSHTYAVQALVTDAAGKQLYASDRSAVLPKSGNGNSAVVNVTVR